MSLIRSIFLSALLSAQAGDEGASKVVIGPQNRFLAEGAEALRAGDFAEGVRLTGIGLQMVRSNRHRAVGLSNLCAGLIRLADYASALEYCDQAIALRPGMWHAHSNRANALLHLNRLDEAEQALDAGLALNPKAEILLRVLDKARAMRYRAQVTIDDHEPDTQ